MRTVMMTSLMILALLAPTLAVAQNQCRPLKGPSCWLAQGGPPDDGGHRRHWGPGRTEAPDFRHLEQLRLLKMLEVLELSEGQEVAFVTLFHGFREEMRRLQEENREVVTQLADGLAEDTLDDATIEGLIDRVHELKRQQFEHLNELMEESEQILTPCQRGKLVVFHERFEAEMLKKLRAFRERRFNPGMSDNEPSPAPNSNEPQ